MSDRDPFAGSEELRGIITGLFETPEYSQWVPKTSVIQLEELRKWISSPNIEIVGFARRMVHDKRFRVEPPLPLQEYLEFEKRYYEWCLRENPDGEWSDSRYSAGMDLVNIFAALWRDEQVPRAVLSDLKKWLGQLYRDGDEAIRTCIVQATLEHLFEQRPIREFFSDSRNDQALRTGYDEACLWPDGGGRTPLGKPDWSL